MSVLETYSYKRFNRWFNACTKQCHDGVEHAISFEMIKISSGEINHYVDSEEVYEKFHKKNHTLLFHGAQQARSVDDLLRDGIILERGGPCLDFSHKNGFYLSDVFEAADDWGLKGKQSLYGVLIYCVPNYLLVFRKNEGLDLSDDNDLLSPIVIYNRSGKKKQLNLPTWVDLDNRSFIKGPVSKNVCNICKRRPQKPIPLEINGRKIQQYCILQEGLARKFSPLVVGVVMNKS